MIGTATTGSEAIASLAAKVWNTFSKRPLK
jgi:hypothetical protein